jgi:hypothetical protein
MSKFDRERVQYLTEELRHRASMSAFRPATKAEIEEAAKMLESALALHDEHERLLTDLRESFNLCPSHQPDQWEGDGTCVICEAVSITRELERLKAAHATLLSREAKEEALYYASWAGAIGAGVARRIKAGTDTDLEPKAAVTAFHHAIAARRLLDLDPEDAA